MAIYIPSKSIYKKDNPKVRDNVIDKIEVNSFEVVPNNDYETPIYNESIEKNELFSSVDEITKYNKSFNVSNAGLYSGSKSYASLKQKYLQDYEISFDDLKNNSYITKVYEKLNKDQEENIKYTVYYDYKEYDVSVSNIIDKYTENVGWEIVELANYSEILKKSNTGSGKIPSDSIVVGTPNVSYASGVEIKDYNKTNLSSLDIKHENGIYYLSINVLVGIEKLTLYGYKSTGLDEEVNCSGKRIVYEPKKLEITLYGDTIGIDLNDKTITIGEGNKPLSFEGNELMQTTNYLNTPINGETNAIKYLYGETLNAFKNGKETATIRCSIKNYYMQGYDDTPIVDIMSNDKKYISLDMQVQPRVYTASGKDIPMSTYDGGKTKTFNVLSTRILNEGVTMQELVLQEADR